MNLIMTIKREQIRIVGIFKHPMKRRSRGNQFAREELLTG